MTAATHLIRKDPQAKKNALPVQSLDQKDAIVLSLINRAVDQDPIVLLTLSTMRHAYKTLLEDCQGKFLEMGSAIFSITSLLYCARLRASRIIQRPHGIPMMMQRFLLLMAGLALVSGCAHAPEVDSIVHEAPKGSVYLERI